MLQVVRRQTQDWENIQGFLFGLFLVGNTSDIMLFRNSVIPVSIISCIVSESSRAEPEVNCAILTRVGVSRLSYLEAQLAKSVLILRDSFQFPGNAKRFCDSPHQRFIQLRRRYSIDSRFGFLWLCRRP